MSRLKSLLASIKRVIPAKEPVRKSIRIEYNGRRHSEKNRRNGWRDRILPNGGHEPAEKNRVGVLVVRAINFLTNSKAETPPAAAAAARAIATGLADLTFCDKVEMFVSGAAASHAGEKRCRCHRIRSFVLLKRENLFQQSQQQITEDEKGLL